jgi:hypothetical protein
MVDVVKLDSAGLRGAGAYEYWIAEGNVGTVQDFLDAQEAAAAAQVALAVAAKDDAETAAAAAAASASGFSDLQVEAGVTGDDVSTATIGSTTPNTNTLTTTDFSYSPAAPIAEDGYLRSASIRLSASGTGRWLIVNAAGRVVYDEAVTVATTPETFAFDNIPVKAGSRLYYRQLTGGGLRSVNASGNNYYVTNSTYSGSLEDAVTVTHNTGEVSLSYDVASFSENLKRRIDDLVEQAESVNDSLQDSFRASRISTTNWTAATGFNRYYVGNDVGADIPVGAVISSVTCELLTPATATHLRVRIFSRLTASGNINTVPILDEDVFLQAKIIDPADVGLTPGATSLEKAVLPIDAINAEAGKTYFAILDVFNSAEAAINFGLGYTASTESRQRKRGWVFTTVVVAADAAVEVSIGFSGYTARQSQTSYDDRVTKAVASATGLDLTTTATFDRNGVPTELTDSARAISGATNVRYDTLYYDALAGTFGVVAGTDRVTDAPEFIPAIGASTRIPLFNLKVTPTTVTPVAVWDVHKNDTRRLTVQAEQDRAYSRRCLRTTLGKIARGDALSIVSIGDSIVAMANANPSQATPNGDNRDRAAAATTDTYHYLRDNIGSPLGAGNDIVDAIALYTAVQLGRSADTAGTTHTRFGFVWDLIAALEDYGYVLGTDLTYDNFGYPGATTATALASGAAWLNAAVALNRDVAIVNFGMNADASLEANLITIANAFHAAGTDVILMGRARKRADTLATFEEYNRAIRRAAEYTNSAFVPYLPLYDEKYIGSIGLAVADCCVANANNHPGIIEHAAIGRELSKLVLG